jgi:type III pantothenate kinase
MKTGFSSIVIDAGNTSTTIALFRGADNSVSATTAVRGGISAARGACAVALRKAFAQADAFGERVSCAMMASVTPSVNDSWSRLVREEAGLELQFVRHDMGLPFKLEIPRPETMGADRLADMAAAALAYGAPALVVDIGTAVTYDLLSADGRFFTGVIGPGPEILARSLHDYTALLPLVEWWKHEPPAVPKDTEGAMLFGIDAGFCGVVRETVNRLMPQVGAGANLIATGGFAPRFISKLRLNFTIDPDLTLRGVGLLAATAVADK